MSQRYVDESEAQTVYHPALGEEERWMVDNAMDQATERYSNLVERLTARGTDRKTARGAARGVLPNATATEIIVTGNHRTWRELLAKRLSPAADAEIRELAVELLKQLKELAPNTYQDIEVPK